MNRKDKSFIIYTVLTVMFFASSIVNRAMGEDRYVLMGWIGGFLLVIVFTNIHTTQEKK